MQPGDRLPFMRELVVLSELFGKPLSPAVQTLYFDALQDLDLERVSRAMNNAVQTATFMPKPAELRKLAVGDDEDAAERAWLAFRAAMRAVGSYASLVVADSALAEAITAIFGSWPMACSAELSPEMWASKRKEFGRVYRVLQRRNLAGARYLQGICEQQNSGRRDWLAYVPVKRLAGDAIETLSLEQAEAARTQLAAESHGFTRLGEGDPPDVEPIDRGDTA